MTREVSDPEGISWTCIQAFAGLGGNGEKTEAARVEGAEDRFHVVCTPSGGAKSVRIELPRDWKTAISDEDLVRAIRAKLSEDA